jgi:hypothetical protein
MAVTPNNVISGQQTNSTSSISSSVGSTFINTSGADELVCILFATARTDTVFHENRVSAVSATGLTFAEAFDVTMSADVGGSFPITTFHLQLWVAPAASQQTAKAWSSSMSDGFANLQSAIVFSLSGLADITAAFDGNVGAALADYFTAQDVTGSTGTPTVNMDTINAND